MSHRYIFLETLEEIRSRLAGSKYDLIKSCGLLRLLFIDAAALYNKVNREIGHKVIFNINNFDDDMLNKGTVLIWERLLPCSSSTKSLKLSEFLSSPVLYYMGEKYSVKDVILLCAHVLGGVHVGKPNNDREKRLLDFFPIDQSEQPKSFMISTFEQIITLDEIGFDSIRQICTISLLAVKPIEDKLKAG